MSFGSGPIRSWADRALEVALGLAAAAWLLNWAWQVVRPLLPVLVPAGLLVAFARWQRR